MRRAVLPLALAPLAALFAVAAAAQGPMPSGYPGRGRIGIEVQPMTAELREFFHAPPTEGVLIVRVEAGRPAQAAKLAVGDVVIAAAGEPLVRPQDLVAIVARAPGGEPLELTVVRTGQTHTIAVLPDGEPASREALQDWHERVGQPGPALPPLAPGAPAPGAASGEPALHEPALVPPAPAPAPPQ